MDIIATLCATLTTSEAHPVDLLSNAPQRIKGVVVGGERELAGSGISLDVMMMINQEPYNMTADLVLGRLLMIHNVDSENVNKLFSRDLLFNVQHAHIWQQSKQVSG